MPTLRQVNQRLARGDADRRAAHQRDYLDRGIPQAHTKQWSTDRVEPRWAMHEGNYSVEYQSAPHGPLLACVRPLTGVEGTPALKDGMLRDLGAAVGAAKRQQAAQEAPMQHWLTFKRTAGLLEITEHQLRSLVEAGEIHMNQPKRDGLRRFSPTDIYVYLTANGSFSEEQIAAFSSANPVGARMAGRAMSRSTCTCRVRNPESQK